MIKKPYFVTLKQDSNSYFYQLKSKVMTKRKTRSYHAPTTNSNRTSKEPSKAQRIRDTKDAKKFFIVLIIGTILLVSFLYFIFVRRG